MKKILISTSVFLFIWEALVLPVHADRPNVINGIPCFANICLGDKLQDLELIEWKTINPRTLQGTKGKDARIKAIGLTQEAKAYLGSNLVDKKGIKAFSKVKGFCEPLQNGLFGSFKRNGESIDVEFKLIASDDGKKQGFLVTKITRNLNEKWSKLTTAQHQQLNKDLSDKYPSLFNSNDSVLVNYHLPVVTLRSVTLGDDLQIIISASIVKDEQNKSNLKKFTGCEAYYKDENRRIPI
jgi:hypothetical protein